MPYCRLGGASGSSVTNVMVSRDGHLLLSSGVTALPRASVNVGDVRSIQLRMLRSSSHSLSAVAYDVTIPLRSRCVMPWAMMCLFTGSVKKVITSSHGPDRSRDNVRRLRL